MIEAGASDQEIAMRFPGEPGAGEPVVGPLAAGGREKRF
jgi:hypothetical protein